MTFAICLQGAASMTVSVATMAGSRLMFKIFASTPLEKLFRAFADARGRDISELRFIHHSKQLENMKNSCSHYGIQDGDAIHCVAKLRGD